MFSIARNSHRTGSRPDDGCSRSSDAVELQGSVAQTPLKCALQYSLLLRIRCPFVRGLHCCYSRSCALTDRVKETADGIVGSPPVKIAPNSVFRGLIFSALSSIPESRPGESDVTDPPPWLASEKRIAHHVAAIGEVLPFETDPRP